MKALSHYRITEEIRMGDSDGEQQMYVANTLRAAAIARFVLGEFCFKEGPVALVVKRFHAFEGTGISSPL